MDGARDPTRSCNGCRFAEWFRTGTNRLSPIGRGKCRYEFPPVIFPWAYRYEWKIQPPIPQYVNRRDDHDPCPTWEKQQ